MKQSTNYNMNKPDPNDMFSLEHWNQNTDKIDETLVPTFEDYTGETPVPTTDEALKNIKSKTKLSILMQNIKAFCKGCCTLGMLVDNCVTNNNNLPLAASQGKILMDQITSLNNNLGNTTKFLRTDNIDNAAKTLWPKIEESSSYDFTWIPNSGTGITSGAQARVIGFYSNNNYESQMVLTYLTSAPISQREKINGSWGKWKVFVTKSDLANKTKSGSATISTKQNDSTALQIRFDEPFPSRPYVTVSLNTDNANTNTKISVFGIDQTGFKVSIYDTAATTRRIEWIASV